MLYVFNTWVLANLLYMAVVLLLYGNPQGEFFSDSAVSVYITGTIFSFLLSLPSLAGGFIVFRLLKATRASRLYLFFVWLVFTPLLALLPWLLVSLWTGNYQLYPEEYQLLYPALIVAVLSVLLRFPFFFKQLRQSSADAAIKSNTDLLN